MKAPSLLARLRQSRRISLMVFAISLLALIVSAIWFINARSALAEAYNQLGNRKQALAEAQVREQEAQLKAEHAASARELLQAANGLGLRNDGWGERLVSMAQSQISREDAATLMESMTRNGDRVFGAQQFEVSVTKPQEGLFDVPVTNDRVAAPLMLSIRGNVLFRTTAHDSAIFAIPAVAPVAAPDAGAAP
jgi:Ca2+/Na+ antiporter